MVRPSPAVLPLLILGIGAVAVYGVARLITRRNQVLACLTSGVLAAGIGALWRLEKELAHNDLLPWAPEAGAPPALLADPGALLVAYVALALGLLVAVYSGQYLALDHRYEDYYPLLLLLMTGVVGMVMAVDLFVLYLFTMLTSSATYVLVAFRRHTDTAIEASFKYLIMGSMAGMLLLAGIGLVFRGAGSISLPLQAAQGDWPREMGTALVMFAYLVKAAIVPGHTWLPDAHGRAPSSVSALLSGIVIQAYLYVLLRVSLGLGVAPAYLGWVLLVLAGLNMLVGNLVAMRQVYGKRLLGYSSIAQVGYMLAALGLGLAYKSAPLIAAGFLLLVAHAAAKGLAFMCKGIYHYYCGATHIEDLAGMASRAPLVAGCFAVAIAALCGLPPLAGFTAKYYALIGFFRLGGAIPALVAGFFLSNSLLSLAYYLPLLGQVLRPDETLVRIRPSLWMQLPIAALGVSLLALGLAPDAVLSLAERAAQFLLRWGTL